MPEASPSDSRNTSGRGVGWPGRHLGLPEAGPRSIARFGRRLGAFTVDIALGAVVSLVFFDYDRWASLIIFIVMQVLFISVVNGSIGHLVFGMRLVPVKGGLIGVWRPILRTLLLSIIIPAVITDQDKRGMHDRVAGTMLVRR